LNIIDFLGIFFTKYERQKPKRKSPQEPSSREAADKALKEIFSSVKYPRKNKNLDS